MTTDIALCGELLQLHTAPAVVWPARHTLFVADLHLGKEHVFSRQGVPLPIGPSQDTVHRLSRLIEETGAMRLVVLGDLMHAAPKPGENWLDDINHFLDQHPELDVLVCTGNHDVNAGITALDPRLSWASEPVVDGPFVLQHHPGEDRRGYVLCGHVHPMYRLRQHRRASVRLPVFWLRQGHAVLPAFGSFTGGHNIQPSRGDRLWVCGPDRVLPIVTTTHRKSP